MDFLHIPSTPSEHMFSPLQKTQLSQGKECKCIDIPMLCLHSKENDAISIVSCLFYASVYIEMNENMIES